MTDAITLVPVQDGWKGRFRCGAAGRPYVVVRVSRKELAQARAVRMQDVVSALVAAKLDGSALSILSDLANAKNDAAFSGVEKAARFLIGEARNAASPSSPMMTFRQLALDYISGDMRARFPDSGHRRLVKPLRPRTVESLTTHLNRVSSVLGHLPVSTITKPQCDAVKKKLAADGLDTPTRRGTLIFVRLMLSLAVNPLELIQLSPIDASWIPPKLPRARAFQYLDPREDAIMLRCKKIPLVYRLFYAFLVRNGGRLAETLAITWGDITLSTGKCNLDETKTDHPRWWVLDPDVVRALAAFKPIGAGPDALVFDGVPYYKAARTMRKHLALTGIFEARPELMKQSASRRWLCVHDLRATFVTVAMACGWTEFEIMRRSGHVTSSELQKYERDVAELQAMGMQWFGDLDVLLGVGPRPEVAQTAFSVARKSKIPSNFKVIDGGIPRSQRTERGASPVVQTPNSAEKHPRAPRSADHGPPTSGGVAQTVGPPPSFSVAQAITAAIAAAATAGKWALVDRLTAQLEALDAAGSVG